MCNGGSQNGSNISMVVAEPVLAGSCVALNLRSSGYGKKTTFLTHEDCVLLLVLLR